ncbi:hypothetical protein K435DRAFT_960261 [Dendrothele bispora CBS 962.96]|uniref:Uncharacterized protein n=1 Tax=Dendrothele bispora (strain CBS 962.96) TaxID=1314807 RepID=A0A4S8MTV3_DENBC|nr:hypothetical protein K435DRAFT_960261 [Dendrothele bispora CBS 962.96]
MGASSPASFMLWSILATLFQLFLIVHLYYYDKFQCIKWSSGRQPGAFKRVMTYSYLATVPLLMIFSLSMAVMTYKEGYLVTPLGEGQFAVMAKPIMLWSESSSSWLLPMFFILAVAWSLELVTHLEELFFWLFLLHQGPHKRNWFNSWEFRAWYLGSMTAVLGMPIAVLIRRRQMETCLAWIYFSGSSAGTLTTLCFIYVLFKFPGFINSVKSGGAEPDVVVRLATFYHLNIIRIFFRFLFNFPLLALAIDGIQGPHNIIRNQPASGEILFFISSHNQTDTASDLLAMLGGVGCFVSSAITFLIFFPRSITRESGFRVKICSHDSIDKPVDSTTSQLPDYNHSQKSPVLVHQSSVGMMNAFRFPNQPPPIPDWQTDTRSSYGGEATPQYESDPENFIGNSPQQLDVEDPLRARHKGGDDNRSWNTHEMWDMQSEEMRQQLSLHSKKKSPRGRPRPRPDLGRPYSFGDLTPPSGKSRRPGAVVYPSIPRIDAIVREAPPSHSNRSSMVIHPYVMTFTSPIDLLDREEEDMNVGRAV